MESQISGRGEVPRKSIVSKVKIQRKAVGPYKQSCKNLPGIQQSLGEVKLHIQVVSYLELLSGLEDPMESLESFNTEN